MFSLQNKENLSKEAKKGINKERGNQTIKSNKQMYIQKDGKSGKTNRKPAIWKKNSDSIFMKTIFEVITVTVKNIIRHKFNIS